MLPAAGTGKVSPRLIFFCLVVVGLSISDLWTTGFSPDPYLSGVAVAETMRGSQDVGVVATTKHFIGNEQENFRQAPEAQGYGFNVSESLSSNIDDTTLHELYLW